MNVNIQHVLESHPLMNQFATFMELVLM
jgi:hypothetical protein